MFNRWSDAGHHMLSGNRKFIKQNSGQIGSWSIVRLLNNASWFFMFNMLEEINKLTFHLNLRFVGTCLYNPVFHYESKKESKSERVRGNSGLAFSLGLWFLNNSF